MHSMQRCPKVLWYSCEYQYRGFEWWIRSTDQEVVIAFKWSFWQSSEQVFAWIASKILINANKHKKIIIDCFWVNTVCDWFTYMLAAFWRVNHENSFNALIVVKLSQEMDNMLSAEPTVYNMFEIQVVHWSEITDTIGNIHQAVGRWVDNDIVESAVTDLNAQLDQFQVIETPDQVIVKISGILDFKIHWVFRDTCTRALKQLNWRQLILDLTTISNLDQLGLGILLLFNQTNKQADPWLDNIWILATWKYWNYLAASNFHKFFQLYIDGIEKKPF